MRSFDKLNLSSSCAYLLVFIMGGASARKRDDVFSPSVFSFSRIISGSFMSIIRRSKRSKRLVGSQIILENHDPLLKAAFRGLLTTLRDGSSYLGALRPLQTIRFSQSSVSILFTSSDGRCTVRVEMSSSKQTSDLGSSRRVSTAWRNGLANASTAPPGAGPCASALTTSSLPLVGTAAASASGSARSGPVLAPILRRLSDRVANSSVKSRIVPAAKSGNSMRASWRGDIGGGAATGSGSGSGAGTGAVTRVGSGSGISSSSSKSSSSPRTVLRLIRGTADFCIGCDSSAASSSSCASFSSRVASSSSSSS